MNRAPYRRPREGGGLPVIVLWLLHDSSMLEWVPKDHKGSEDQHHVGTDKNKSIYPHQI